MSDELLINVCDFETRVCLLNQGSLQEIHLDRAGGYSVTGNIYKGRVERIVPGMQAAFVDIGLSRPGFLHVRDLQPRRSIDDDGENKPIDIRELIHEGQKILVQVAKDPISTKGARLSANLAIPARYLVLLPGTDHIGISQRIEDEVERERLKELIANSREKTAPGKGFIARTVGEGIGERAVEIDMRLLARIWEKVKAKRAGAQVGDILYQELPLHIRVVRDLAGPELSRIVVDDMHTYARIKEFIDEYLPEFSDRLEHHQKPRPLLEHFCVENDLKRLFKAKVSLKSGGSLVIEQTEAMITIDVNTGGYLGGNCLEETVYRTNLEAAAAIPKQLRLRNFGGIVVIDFIDMIDPEHQRQVLRCLEKGCQADSARIHLEGFSSLGLVQLSRKRTRKSLIQQVCEPCNQCSGRGYVKTPESACIEIFRTILEDSSRRGVQERCEREKGKARPHKSPIANHQDDEYLVRAHQSVVDRLLDEDAEQLARLSKCIQQQIRIQVEPIYGPDQFDVVVAQGVQQ